MNNEVMSRDIIIEVSFVIVLIIILQLPTFETVFSSISNDEIRTIIRQTVANIFKNDDAASAPVDGQIRDTSFDWIYFNNSRPVFKIGNPSTDILSVDYSNNGKFLNATIWIA